jgi:hypothetical protein
VADTAFDSPNTVINVFAVEMVYMPEGSFYIGDGSDGSSGEFELGDGTYNLPATISNSGVVKFYGSTGGWELFYNTDAGANDNANGANFEVGASYPKGYDAFYLMKYEIQESEWVGFFNTLTTTQKLNHDITGATGKNSDGVVNRNTVSWNSASPTSAATTTRAWRACSYLSLADVAAFADWAALRPFTEFEYEKAARGPLYPVLNEYAWGSTTISSCTSLSGAENGAETCTSGNARYGQGNVSGGDTAQGGPLRAGIFATASSTRGSAGAGYYGAMELSGNLWERAVTVGNSSGRNFAGSHGDGTLNTNGYATNSDWPGYTANGVDGASGSGIRGGGWNTPSGSVAYLRISNRYKAGTTDTTRTNDFGGRLARTP